MRNSLVLQKTYFKEKYSLWAILETLCLTAGVLLICYLINPKNPMFLHAIFPWPWIASIIIVLKYGFGYGFLSAAIISALTVLIGPRDALIMPDYQNYILSGFAFTLFCGLFVTNLKRRCQNAEALLNFTEEKLSNLSRSYYQLNISHNNLVQNLIIQPTTIRGVLEQLQKLNINSQAKRLIPEIAYPFLQLVSDTCSLFKAAIYRYDSKILNTSPLVEVGGMSTLNLNDPVAKNFIKTEEISYIRGDNANAHYLAAIPMRNYSGELVAVLMIEEMSFKNLTQDTLKLVSILANYFIEDIALPEKILDVVSKIPDCPIEFVKELQKLLNLKLRVGINSAITTLLIAHEYRHFSIIEYFISHKRTLDTVWVKEMPGYDVIITLMPLADANAVQGYFNRVSKELLSQFNLKVDQGKIKTRSQQLLPQLAPITVIENFNTLIQEAAGVN